MMGEHRAPGVCQTLPSVALRTYPKTQARVLRPSKDGRFGRLRARATEILG